MEPTTTRGFGGSLSSLFACDLWPYMVDDAEEGSAWGKKSEFDLALGSTEMKEGVGREMGKRAVANDICILNKK